MWGAWASEPSLVLLTEPWPPYVMAERERDGDGADLELARVVLKRMGYGVEVRQLPWKRVLLEARQAKGDAVVDIFYEKERESWVYYPSEPLSRSGEVLFSRRDAYIDYQGPASLAGKRIGVQADYAYGHEFLSATGFERVPMTGEKNVPKQLQLLRERRLDGVVLNQWVGAYWLGQLELGGEITHSPRTITTDNRNFLGFTHKPGHDRLAVRFSEELVRFKKTAEYRRLLARYGLAP
ncbi:substrate-binding periplasmic protein [Aeromonas schubertii]|uniref:ABC transporter substrate-binding protein n=1 Tax=Aeromonas schubertii TaxID=652 RepID=A0A0S2SII3_9GAMM|nr:ABC transporter substrate-binding protein [Aeromonas schubertii]